MWDIGLSSDEILAIETARDVGVSPHDILLALCKRPTDNDHPHRHDRSYESTGIGETSTEQSTTIDVAGGGNNAHLWMASSPMDFTPTSTKLETAAHHRGSTEAMFSYADCDADCDGEIL